MTTIAFESIVIIFLIVANGLFAMSELAIVAARKSRLQDWAEKGSASARSALELAENPNQFFSTVQNSLDSWREFPPLNLTAGQSLSAPSSFALRTSPSCSANWSPNESP